MKYRPLLIAILIVSSLFSNERTDIETLDQTSSQIQYTESGLLLPQYMSSDDIQFQLDRGKKLRRGGIGVITAGTLFIPGGLIVCFIGDVSEEEGDVNGALMLGGGVLMAGGVAGIVGGVRMIRKGRDIRNTYENFAIVPIVDPFTQTYGTQITISF